MMKLSLRLWSGRREKDGELAAKNAKKSKIIDGTIYCPKGINSSAKGNALGIVHIYG